MLSELKNFAYSFKELDISVGLIEEAMGYVKGQSPEPFPDMIAYALKQSNELCNVQGSLLVSDNTLSNIGGGNICVNDVVFNVGNKIARQLKNCEGGALFICTAGAGIGERSKKLMAAGDLIEGYLFDVIGSVTVEAAIDKIQDNFENELFSIGKNLTNRYSPGYCGWALREQKQLFSLFPHGHCGITLSESCLMDPIKSVSGIIGYGTNVKKMAYECQMCELETCIYRKIRLAKGK